MVRTREDGFVAVATHGNGMYSAKFEVTPLPQPTLTIVNPIADINLFVNNTPAGYIDVSTIFNDSNGDSITYSIINTNPAIVTATLTGNLLTLVYTPGVTGRSTIGIVASSGIESLSDAFNITISNFEGIIYSQATPQAGTRPSQLFTNFGNALAQSADDFVIPAGQTWSIEKVFAPGAVGGAPVLNAARVVIYRDTLGIPGIEVYNSGNFVPSSGTSNPSLELTLPVAANLSAGNYWISVYVQLAFVGSAQWFWATTATVTGAQAHFRDPANLFGRGAINWTPMSTAFGGAPNDMLFTLFGKATGVPAPAAPTNLTALYQNAVKFNLNWVDNSSDEQGFIIERSTNGVNFAKRVTVGVNVTSFSDTDIFSPTEVYFYRVAAIGLSDTSAYSNIDSTAVLPTTPKALLASFVKEASFIANWEPSEGVVRYYELDVFEDGNYFAGFKGRPVTGTSFKVTGTKRGRLGRQYEYVVRAVGIDGSSKDSETIIVSPIRKLSLASVCSDNPDVTRRWKVTNPNPFPIQARWFIHMTSQADTITVRPGVSYFVTPTVAKSSNTIFLLWKDDWMSTKLVARYSSTVQCTGVNDDVAIIDGRGRQTNWEEVETEVPFITETWPNPAREKFNILVSSPFEDEVELELYNTNGDRIKSLTVESNSVVEIDAKNYASGMYVLKVKQLIYSESVKLIKE
jgi:hypothetical protein